MASRLLTRSVKWTRSFSTMPDVECQPKPYSNQNPERIKAIRKSNLVPSLFHYYKEPLIIHQGHKQWLFDHNNKRYLDLFGGIVTVSVGHCHPSVNRALQNQVAKLWHTTNIYLHPEIHEYAELLVGKFPDPLKVVCFTNSGSEANDLAFLMAKLYTKRNEIITLRNSYHGMSSFSMGATNLSSWRFNAVTHHGFIATMNPDPYRGPWGGSHCRDSPVQTNRACQCSPGNCEACDKYIDQLEDVLRFSTPKSGIAGFIAESIQGVGGTVQFPKDFLAKAYPIIRNNGGVCIADEVQTGFGRLGQKLWGFQHHNVLPDIVTLAKGIGNGFPLAAVVTSKEIAESLTSALTFNTYGGNPLACAVGKAVLNVIDEEKLMENCEDVGTYFLLKLESLKQKYECIGDVRGKGLMIGVEMVESRSNNKPLNLDRMNKLWEDIKDMGVLLGKGGLYGNVFRIKPPMCVTRKDVDFAISIMDMCLSRNI